MSHVLIPVIAVQQYNDSNGSGHNTIQHEKQIKQELKEQQIDEAGNSVITTTAALPLSLIVNS